MQSIPLPPVADPDSYTPCTLSEDEVAAAFEGDDLAEAAENGILVLSDHFICAQGDDDDLLFQQTLRDLLLRVRGVSHEHRKDTTEELWKVLGTFTIPADGIANTTMTGVFYLFRQSSESLADVSEMVKGIESALAGLQYDGSASEMDSDPATWEGSDSMQPYKRRYRLDKDAEMWLRGQEQSLGGSLREANVQSILLGLRREFPWRA